MRRIFYILLFLLCLLCGCQRDWSARVTNVETIGAEFLDGGEISINAEVRSVGTPTIDRRGVCYSLKQSPTIDDNIFVDKENVVGPFSCKISGLEENTTYYVRAFVQNSFGLVYGDEITFTTLTKPTVETLGTEKVSEEGFKVKGRIVANGGGEIKKCGFCYDTNEMPTVEGSHTEADVASDEFSSEINGLSSGQRYYVRAYAQNACGISYGEQIVVYTHGLATVNTMGVDNITESSAACHGYIEFNGGESITEKGVCWDIVENPTIQGSHLACGTEDDSYSCIISGLTISTTYYVRAYAVNKYGTSYGNQLTFTTNGYPSVTMGNVTNISSTSAVCSGNILSNGGDNIIDRGFCYGLSNNPTIYATKVSAGSGSGPFSYTLSGLSSGTTYYVIAYAENKYGKSYSPVISFNTIGLPTVNTGEISNVTSSSAICTGTIISTGGSYITDMGVCYSLSNNPTISDFKVPAGSSSGSFSCILSGLSSGETYYVRAYATNSCGTAYGGVVQLNIVYRETVKDICGNTYTAVKIGTQIWMAENIRCNKYDSQSELPNGTLSIVHQSKNYAPYYINASDKTEWKDESTWCKPDNLSESQINKLGYLYNWGAAVALSTKEKVQSRTIDFVGKRQGICPNGWHIPTRSEWDILCKYLGGAWKEYENGGHYDKGANALKTKTGWYYKDGTDTDTYGFSALPSGCCYGGAQSLYGVGKDAYFWTSTPYDQTTSCVFDMSTGNQVFVWQKEKHMGYSVRCVKN